VSTTSLIKIGFSFTILIQASSFHKNPQIISDVNLEKSHNIFFASSNSNHLTNGTTVTSFVFHSFQNNKFLICL
jgi:hypothetical protein